MKEYKQVYASSQRSITIIANIEAMQGWELLQVVITASVWGHRYTLLFVRDWRMLGEKHDPS